MKLTDADDICDWLILTIGQLEGFCTIGSGDSERDLRARAAARNASRFVPAISALRELATQHRAEFSDLMGSTPIELEPLL